MTKLMVPLSRDQADTLYTAFLLIEKVLQHLEDPPMCRMVSNEISWLEDAQSELAYLIAHVEGFKVEQLDALIETGLQLHLKGV